MTREHSERLSEQAAGARPGVGSLRRPGRGRAGLRRSMSVRPSICPGGTGGPSTEVVPDNFSADGATRKHLDKPTEPHAAPS